MNILVTGSAGYIGNVFCELITEETNHTVYGIDKRYSLSDEQSGRFAKFSGDYCRDDLGDILFKWNIDAVVHFAGRIEVGKSAYESGNFYLENVGKPTALFGKIAHHQKLTHKQIPVVCSSSAAVYGSYKESSYSEAEPKNPISVYGQTKSTFEDIAESFSSDKQHYLDRVSSLHFRYFNAAGAYKNRHGIFGENHNDCTHIIPNLLKSSKLNIFGHDYNTHDGTAERDYVHVIDIARAHLRGIELLNRKIRQSRSHFDVINLGSGFGTTILQLAERAKCLGLLHDDHQIEFHQRRLGDPDTLVANTAKAVVRLGWQVENGIDSILKSAHEYHCGNKK
jgi:UDP-glucose 4-epimerase